jgi:transglutaminase-like putative cysteine protease
MKKTYICPRYPFYAIGDKVKFNNGLFITEDPKAIALVETNDWYNVFILDATSDEPVSPPWSNTPVDLDRHANKPVVHDRTNVPDEGRYLPPEVTAELPTDPLIEYKNMKPYKFERMSQAGLVDLARKIGVGAADEETKASILKRVYDRLGIKY